MSFLGFAGLDLLLRFDFDLPLFPPLLLLLPLPSVLSNELVSPEFLLLESSFNIKSRTLAKVRVSTAPVTAVIVPDQLSGNEDKSRHACSSSSILNFTEFKRDK
ncbi:hypothetical protein Hanom_Chr00s079682g01793231 [Helianthus anomalus]